LPRRVDQGFLGGTAPKSGHLRGLAGPNLKTLAEPVLNAEMNLFSR